jgi:hypothetical protein
MPTLRVCGGASGRLVGQWEIDSPQENLMRWLQRHGVNVASSCDGEGVCRKCIVNGDTLSCQITVGALVVDADEQVVTLSYL